MTDTPDLHTLAADTGTQYAGLTDMERAAASADFHMRTCDVPTITDCAECQRRLDRIQAYIAAVLPAHRRQVLAEAARHYGEMARNYAEMASDREWLTTWLAAHGLSTTPGPGPVIQAVARDLQDVVRRLASAAAETAPTPRHSDETAPAVPEDHPFAQIGRQGVEAVRAFVDAFGKAYGPAISALASSLGAPAVPEEAAEAQGPAEGDGRVPLAEVLAALRDENAVVDFAERHGDDYDGWYVEVLHRERMCLYLAERFATAPRGANAHSPVPVADYQSALDAMSDALWRIRGLAINADAVVNGWNLDPQQILDVLPDFAAPDGPRTALPMCQGGEVVMVTDVKAWLDAGAAEVRSRLTIPPAATPADGGGCE